LIGAGRGGRRDDLDELGAFRIEDAFLFEFFGDYYYLNTKATCYVHGGGFDHYWRCGLFTLRGWATDTQKWYLYGSRLIYKPVKK
jgi:hypothetical protein